MKPPRQVLFGAVLILASGAHSIADDDLIPRVRSLLSNRCFACHGPDEDARQGGLRLDHAAGLSQEADSGEVPIQRGDASASELFRRITTNESERMPPAEFGPGLSSDEVALIRQWIEAGAAFAKHWSFERPVRPPVPESAVPENAVSKNDVPESDQLNRWPHWQHNPIDRFVLRKMLSRGLSPSPGATRAALLRRVSLDLIGLPPTPAELERFLADPSPNAYEHEVERLLASPAFGEHWARKWLDLARYADSAGYADDPARTIWAYRDWVIQAHNDGMPIDQFTIEQLAGDLLPNPTTEQLVATAFHRNTLTNNEGGTNDEEFRNVAIVDRVNTTMAVWMGVTMACAQCHTHKYDPFTQEEYFQLFAVFNQSQDADRRDESPTIPLFSAEQEFQRRQWIQRRDELESILQEVTPELKRELLAWESKLTEPCWSPIKPQSFQTRERVKSVLNDASIRVLEASATKQPTTYRIALPIAEGTDPIQAVSIRSLPMKALPSGGAGLVNGNFVLSGISATLVPERDAQVQARFVRLELKGKKKILSLAEVEVESAGQNVARKGSASQSSTDFQGPAKYAIDGNTDGDYTKKSVTHTAISDDPWWEVDLGELRPIDRIRVWNRVGSGIHRRLDGVKVRLLDANRKPIFEYRIDEAQEQAEEVLVRNAQPVQFDFATADFSQTGFAAQASIDGDSASGWAVAGALSESHRLALVPSDPIRVDGPAVLELHITHSTAYPEHLLASFQIEVSRTPTVREWFELGDDLRHVHLTPIARRTSTDQARLETYFARQLAPSTERIRKELSQLDRKLSGLKPSTSVPVLRELESESYRKTFVQIRGNYKSLGKQVTAGTPAIFHAPKRIEKDEDHPIDRLALAEWLVDRRNPLTSRVWVNRTWESLFGRGIVRSSEEFGSQGDRPTHPELLDWLACELMEMGWEQKTLLRKLVTSETYRQTSQVAQVDLEKDKDNVWLARGPRVRLSAEMVRDQALAVAGLLASKMYGKPVRPPQPDLGLKAAFGSATDWKPSEGEDRYRRGVYTTWRRSNPYPSMATFDAPSREVCTLRRDQTNTPLQALVTLNDPGFVEAAQALARRVTSSSSGENDEACLSRAFQLCTCRAPQSEELAALRHLLDSARTELKRDEAAAMQLATIPLGPLPAGGDPVELGAYAAVCNVLLNLDETLMKR